MTRSFRRSRNISKVLSNSCFRSSPVFTKMLVRRFPIARCTSTAATVESTPPLSAQIAHLFPTFSRIAAVVSSINAAPLHFGSALQTRNRKFRSSSVPRSVCFTSGWNSTA